MQILFGIGLFVIYKLTNSPLNIVTEWKGTNWYDPSDELFIHSLKWITLFGSIAFITIGTAHLIKRLVKNG